MTFIEEKKKYFDENFRAYDYIKGFKNKYAVMKDTPDKMWQFIEEAIKEAQKVTEDTSDGYHTFKELYQFRKLYNAGFFNGLPKWCDVHKSKKHSDGKDCFGGGWFIVVAYLPTDGALGMKQISNHYELKDWGLFQCEERGRADAWDGHTSQDVMTRPEQYLKDQVTESEGQDERN